jgi:hypothetical protein
MASIKRHANAVWQGSGKDGKGSLTTQSATLKDTPYTFNTRFGEPSAREPVHRRDADHGTGRRRLEDRRGPSDAARPRAGYRCGEVPGTGRGGKGRLSGLEGAERRDHAGRQAGVIARTSPLRPSGRRRSGWGGGLRTTVTIDRRGASAPQAPPLPGPLRPLGRRGGHTLNRNSSTSPSFTTYSLPSTRIRPASFAPASPRYVR